MITLQEWLEEMEMFGLGDSAWLIQHELHRAVKIIEDQEVLIANLMTALKEQGGLIRGFAEQREREWEYRIGKTLDGWLNKY